MSNNAILQIENLMAGYNANQNVLNGIDLDIGQGEIFGLIGLNGVGKTTLIKIILGLRSPNEGHVFFPGDNKDLKKNLSYLPERFEPPWFLSGFEFIKFSLSLYNKQVSFNDIVDMAKKVSLNEDFLKKKVQTYSKGMRQKLGLLATMLSPCPLLILDEPMSGLDPKARFEVKVLIKSAKEQGKSIFMSSHILSDMAELCDRVAILSEGKIVYTGQPQSMIESNGGKSMEEAFLNIIQAKKA